MSSKEELTTAIQEKGNQIKDLKAAKPPTLKDDLAPLVAELLALKVSYKQVTGEDFDPPKPKKEPKTVTQEETKKEGPSKKDLNKEKRKAEKLAKRAEAKGVTEEQLTSQAAPCATEDDFSHLYGDTPIIQSTTITARVFRNLAELSDEPTGSTIWVRARIHNIRAVSKGSFLILRHRIDTVQAVMFQGDRVSKGMVKYSTGLPLESVVDVLAEITAPELPVQSTTIKNIELKILEIHCISRAEELPFIVDDAGRNDEFAKANGLPVVNPDTCLNYRWLDMRTPANQAIFRIQSGVCQLFREYLCSQGFMEIHTPKLIGGASEGGANVFQLQYFGSPACLAQSPQLYKQMVCCGGGFDRVFEIGPVFRAENSNTHRHLCEFTGMDFEMAIYEHYYEALEVMGEMFHHIFDGIRDRFHHELQVISQQYPFEPLQYQRPPLRISYEEGIALLQAAGSPDASVDDDLSTPNEKWLGQIVKEKYGVDFFMMDKYPLSVRPFYTMPDPKNPKVSNSYDVFIRGEEIVSGAQRIHDPTLLIERANALGVPIPS
ncbi:Dars1, partial [Symbiodinium microadriaticum]